MQNNIRFRNILMNKESIRNLDYKKRSQIISRILSDLGDTDILKNDINIDDNDDFCDDIFSKEQKIEESFLSESHFLNKKKIKKDNILIYGRTPLHQAIANKDIKTIEKYVSEKKYIFDVDNNGNTPYDMAYQEGFEEAIVLLKKCI
jgi:ankyrin repeat protein